MSDITNIDTCDAVEAADDLEKLSMEHAKRTGRYGESSTMKVAADWLRHLDEVQENDALVREQLFERTLKFLCMHPSKESRELQRDIRTHMEESR